MLYAQLARDFGWEAYKTVFRRYDDLSKKDKPKANRKKKICGLSHSQKLLSVTCVLFLTFGDGRFIVMSWRKLIASRHTSQTTRQPVTLLNVERKKFLKSITCNCRYHHNYSGILSIQFKVC
jgi:hypothetical protein